MASLDIIIIVGLAVTLAVAAERPCDSYVRTLSRSESRGVDIEPDYDFNTICDMHTIVEGDWYRVSPSDDVRMHEGCVDIWSCGTQNPMWLDGTHPTDDTVVTRRVCTNKQFGESCCDWSREIKVARCPSTATRGAHFYIYQLVDPDVCDTAYCVQPFTQNITAGATTSTASSTSTTPMASTSSAYTSRRSSITTTSTSSFYFTTTIPSYPTISYPSLSQRRDELFCSISLMMFDAKGATATVYFRLVYDTGHHDKKIISMEGKNVHMPFMMWELEGIENGPNIQKVHCEVRAKWISSRQYSRVLQSDTLDVKVPGGYVRNRSGIIAGSVCATGLVLIIVGATLYLCCRKKRGTDSPLVESPGIASIYENGGFNPPLAAKGGDQAPDFKPPPAYDEIGRVTPPPQYEEISAQPRDLESVYAKAQSIPGGPGVYARLTTVQGNTVQPYEELPPVSLP